MQSEAQKDLRSHLNYVVMFCEPAEWFISFTKCEQAISGMGKVRSYSGVTIEMQQISHFFGDKSLYTFYSLRIRQCNILPASCLLLANHLHTHTRTHPNTHTHTPNT